MPLQDIRKDPSKKQFMNMTEQEVQSVLDKLQKMYPSGTLTLKVSDKTKLFSTNERNNVMHISVNGYIPLDVFLSDRNLNSKLRAYDNRMYRISNLPDITEEMRQEWEEYFTKQTSIQT